MKNIMKNIALLILSGFMVLASSCKKPDYSIEVKTNYDNERSVVITSGTPIIVKYNIVSPTGVTDVKLTSSENIVVTHMPAADKMSGQAVLVLDHSGEDSFFNITCKNAQNSFDYRIDFEMETIRPTGSASLSLPSTAGEAVLKVESNIGFKVVIPEDAASWIEYSGTKTISPDEIVLSLKANEDVKRKAVVTVQSTASSEVKTDFEILQDGILNNLIIGYARDKVCAPELLGSDSGVIYWGDGMEVKWVPNSVHTYVDGRRTHTAEIHTLATGAEFLTLQGVELIDFFDF